MRVGVSQRHVSFVESGRAKPSRELLIAWLQELAAPLALRNEAMLQAGYAPAYTAAPLDDPSLGPAQEALKQLLHAHDPQPALVLDAHWNLLDTNSGGLWLANLLLPNLQNGTPLNMLDALIHPDGILDRIVNLPDMGPAFLSLLRSDAAAHPAIAPKVEAFSSLLHARLGANPIATHRAPVLTTRFATPHGELAFFSMFTTFGTPQDITLASLRVEHLFPADEATRAILKSQVPKS